jgi:hypothetical protein
VVPICLDCFHALVNETCAASLAGVADGVASERELAVMAGGINLGAQLALLTIVKLLKGYPLPPVLEISPCDAHRHQKVDNHSA